MEHPGKPRPAIDPSALLAEAGWVDRLARGLVRDDAAARDLVQETWLAALRAPPAADGRLRPWLARVLLNFARQRKRSDVRRTSREAVAAKPERLPPVSEAAERVEAQRALAEALAALEEPLKATVVLRYFDGLSPAEISKRQGVPAGTVRWRLHRALDELRERLGRGFDGGRSGSWALVLLPLFRKPPLAEIAAGSAAAVAQGVLMTNGILKAVVAAAVVGAASLGVWYAVDRKEPPVATPLVQESAVAPAPVDAATTPEENRLATTPEPERASAATPASVARADTGRVEVRSSKAVLEARFLDEQDRPVEGVRLVLTSLGTGHAAAADEFARTDAPSSSCPSALSGADGRVRIEASVAPTPTGTGVQASHAGLATHFANAVLNAGQTTYLGDVHLAPGGSVAGFVLDDHGAPVRGAEVRVVSPEMTRDLDEARRLGPFSAEVFPAGRTLADGSFRVDGVRLRPVRVWAATDDTRWSFTEPVDLGASPVRTDLELRLQPLQPTDLISGIVLAPDGTPVPSADIRYTGRLRGSTWSGNLHAEDDGRFRFRVTVQGDHDFHARDDKARWPDAAALAVHPGTLDLVLQFPSPRWIELSVHDASGPIEEFAAAVLSADRSHTIVPATIEKHEKGRAAVLVPGETFLVDVRARGHGEATLGPWSPDAAPASERCKLDLLPGIRGQVRANGAPVANATVTLFEIADATTRIVRNGFVMRFHPSPEDTATTDEQGFFQLDASRPGGSKDEDRFFQRGSKESRPFAILCEASGWAIAELSPLEVDPAAGLDGLKIELVRGGAIEGRVLVASGKQPAGVVVGIDRHDGKPRTQRVGPDGAFRFDGLTPGKYCVERVDEELRTGNVSTSWSSGGSERTEYKTNCSVEDGGTTRFDVNVREDAPCVLVAKVRVNGAPATGWTATVVGRDRNHTTQTPGGGVNSTGELRVEVREPGKYVLSLQPPGTGDGSTSFDLPLDLHRGENAVPVDLALGAVRGTCAAPSADSILGFSCANGGKIECNVSARIGAGGRFEMPFVLAGPGFVTRNDYHPDGSIVGPVAKVAVDVPAGGTADAVVP